MNINHNFQNVADSYLFSTIAKKVAEYQQENPKADIIRKGSSRTVHEVCDTLKTGKLHIISCFVFIFIILLFCRCITCQKTLDHKLQESIFCR